MPSRWFTEEINEIWALSSWREKKKEKEKKIREKSTKPKQDVMKCYSPP